MSCMLAGEWERGQGMTASCGTVEDEANGIKQVVLIVNGI